MSAFLLPKTDVYRTSSQGGLLVFNSHSVRMNQDHGPEPISSRDLTTPTRGLERTHSLMVIVASGQNQISTLATAMSAFKPRRSHDPNRSLLRSNQLGPPI
jgi:hypothetical protein